MPGFLYYIQTQVPSVTPKLLQEPGLSHVIDDGDGICYRGCNGPEGRGMVFYRTTDRKADSPSYDPETHDWVKCDGGKWWLGVPKAKRPTPDELKRASYINGFPVPLEDGNVWTVPAITALPVAFGIQDGQIGFDEVDRFAGIREDADRVFQKFVFDAAQQSNEQAGADLTRDDCFDIACRAVALNYRVSKWELAAIRALTTENIYKVLEAMIDAPTILSVAEQLKKNSGIHDGSAMNSGSEGSAPDTGQPTQTSSGSATETTGP